MSTRSRWFYVATIFIAVAAVGGIDQKMKNVLKVQHILKTIEKDPSGPKGPGQTAEVTQMELNDYIDHLIAKEKEAGLDSLQVILLNQNRIKGKLRSDAQHLNLGMLFGDYLDIDFRGTLHTRSGKARIALSSVNLNGLSITPQVLDTIIDAAARYNGTEASSINDWYALPKGVNRIMVRKGKAVLHY